MIHFVEKGEKRFLGFPEARRLRIAQHLGDQRFVLEQVCRDRGMALDSKRTLIA
jgi:hypothetical protein